MKLVSTSLITYFFAALLAAPLVSQAAGEAAPAKVAKPDLVRGEALYTASCVACHAVEGNSGAPMNPKLAQQHPEYMLKQLQEFKSGKRKKAVMALSEDDIKNIAYWMTTKKAKPGLR